MAISTAWRAGPVAAPVAALSSSACTGHMRTWGPQGAHLATAVSLTSRSFSSSRGGPDSASRKPHSPHWGQAALGMRWGARRPPLAGWLICFVLRRHSSWAVLPVPTSRVGISPGDLRVPCTRDSVTASLSITRGEGDSLKMSLPASPRVSPGGSGAGSTCLALTPVPCSGSAAAVGGRDAVPLLWA